MEHVRLGRTGLKVSRAWLGTATFGLQTDESVARQILDEALDLGITVLDTAATYPLGGTLETVGRTEEIIGRWLTGRDDEVLIASKFFGRTGNQPWQAGSSRRHIIASAEQSLRRLGVDHIDLYQAHTHDPETPIDETLAALDDLVRSGKVRYIGCSNMLAYQIMRALGRSALHNWSAFVSVQPRYNLLSRQVENELLPMCREEGLAVLPYNVLAGGMLTGKHRFDAPPPSDSRFGIGTSAERYQRRYWHEKEFSTVAELQALANDLGLPLMTVAVGWVSAQDTITAPILGASRVGQLADAVRGVEWTPDADTLSRLEELTSSYRFAPVFGL